MARLIRRQGGYLGRGVRPRPTSGGPPQPGHLRRQRAVHLSAGISLSTVRLSHRSLGDLRRPRETNDDQAGRLQTARAHRMAKTGESYTAARSHVLAEPPGLQVPDDRAMLAALHVSNGDSTDLPGTGLASRVLYWRDSLHEGPVPAVGPEELRQIRAAFLVGAHADDRAEGFGMFAERDRTLAANRDGAYVLWFEADLYDQLQIIQIL